jgi:hypothetical protein
MAVKVGSKYEWVRGDYAGNVETVGSIEGGFIIFNSGKRCNVDVFEEMMLPAGQGALVMQNTQSNQNSRNQKSYKGVTTVQFEQEDDGDGVIMDANGQPVYVPPVPNINSQGHTVDNPVTEYNQPPVPEKKVNPITLLINQAAKDESELTINYTVKIPRKSVYSLLKDSFQDVDIDNEILETIVSEIDINILKDYFKTQLLEKIKLHYKS